MFCPQCKQTLRVVEEEAFSALLCETCGGVFYPEGEFRKHLELVKTRPQEQVPLNELIGRKALSPLIAGTLPMPCPACETPMKPFNYGYDSNVMLGKCPKCGGLWVEKGQIDQVVRYIKGHPVLDRLADGLMDEQREKQAFERTVERVSPKRSFLAIPLFTFVPVSDADELQVRPVMTWGLVTLNVLLFLFARRYFLDMAMVPSEILRGERLHTLVTSQFAHVGLWHLLGNMLFLHAFGTRVEDRIGRWRFLGTYLMLGVVAGLAHVFVGAHPDEPCLGASGAIGGIMGAYLLLFPTSSVRVVLLYTTVPIPAIIYLGAWFVMQTLIPFTSNVAVAAHIGGFLAGMVAGVVMRYLGVGEPARARSEGGAG